MYDGRNYARATMPAPSWLTWARLRFAVAETAAEHPAASLGAKRGPWR